MEIGTIPSAMEAKGGRFFLLAAAVESLLLIREREREFERRKRFLRGDCC